jgi:hypothetical protein
MLRLNANPADAPCCVKLEASDGRDVLFQTDWDWPAIATLFGWSPCHNSTDGTVTCPECGKTASAMIEEARQWLDDHDGEDCEDPGYLEAQS